MQGGDRVEDIHVFPVPDIRDGESSYENKIKKYFIFRPSDKIFFYFYMIYSIPPCNAGRDGVILHSPTSEAGRGYYKFNNNVHYGMCKSASF
jgi:hypothetical protein